MNCKPGDLAMIVRSSQGCHGAVVEVVRDSSILDSGLVWWECKTLSSIVSNDLITNRAIRLRPGAAIFAADVDMRPLKGEEGEDEILRLVGKPQKEPA